jgi:hypothetical protein
MTVDTRMSMLVSVLAMEGAGKSDPGGVPAHRIFKPNES